jgi:prepilin-type processing-associated H-X9-DG protein
LPPSVGQGDRPGHCAGKLGVRDVRDGTAQTIAAGGRSNSMGDATWAGVVCGAVLVPPPGGTDRVASTSEPEVAVGMGLGHAGEGFGPGDRFGDVNMFPGHHPGGVNFLFVGGPVAFLKTSINCKSVPGPHDPRRRRGPLGRCL